VLKTLHTAHGGKMSIARVLAGQAGDGTTFVTPDTEAGRVSGVFKLMGQSTEKRGACRGGRNGRLGQARSCQDRRTRSPRGKQAHKPVSP
jgi:elongation factor G